MKDLNEIKERIIDNEAVLEYLIDKIQFLKMNNANLKYLANDLESNKYDLSNIRAFKIFESCKDFTNYADELYKVKKWNINEESYSDRAKILSEYDFYNNLKKDFNSLKLVRYPISDEQAISFLDTMSLMYYMMNLLKTNNLLYYNEVKIIMELVIPNKEKNRVDYSLFFRNTIILIEFSLCSSSDNLKKVNRDKKEQVNEYKDELEKYLSDKINLYAETVIYTHDKESNLKLMNNLCDRILNSLNRSSGDSFNEILKIKYYD